jgi:hypothetical protein
VVIISMILAQWDRLSNAVGPAIRMAEE